MASARRVLLRAVALCLLSALAATVLGALTSRAVLPSPATSILVLLGGYGGLLLLGLGPLRPLSLPMIEWMRAAHDGPPAFASAFPSLATRITAWTALGATGYLWIRRTRP